MFAHNSKNDHCRYYQIGGITIKVEADLPIKDTTFSSKFRCFEVEGPGEDMLTIRHYFSLPSLENFDLGEEVYRKPPWAIFRQKDGWTYLGISGNSLRKNKHRWRKIWKWLILSCKVSPPDEFRVQNQHLPHLNAKYGSMLATFNLDHTQAAIYSKRNNYFRRGNLHSLTLFPTDQILLARVLADKKGCFLHAGGVIMDGKGFLFVGHSDAGKSTIVKMLEAHAEILCDDRVIVRDWKNRMRVYGTWSHGDVPLVSSGSAPLSAIFFLEKGSTNRLVHITRKQEAISKLLACLVRPLTTAEWWHNMITLIHSMVREIPCYTLHFDKSGAAVDLLGEF